MKRTKTKSIFGALCLFFAISLFSVFLSIFSNTVSVSAYSAAISTSDSVTLDATINGTGTSIKAEAINIQTDCRAGYNLNIATPNGSNLYLNGNNSENASFTAVDGTSALSSSNNTNKWGYTLAANPTSSTVFLPLSANTSVLKTPAQTANPNSNINDTFNINYGVHTDETITPGAYRMGNNGTIVYYLTMDETCMTVNIAYDGNNADAGTMGAAGTGVIHTGVKDGDTIDLIASNFSRTGYGFAGWSTDQNAGAKLIDNDNTNNPIVYGPQETVTLPNGFTNYDTDNDSIVKLYAVWIPSQGNLQGWMGCSSLDTTTYNSTTGALDLTKNSITALTDQRDNDTYAVARLADGNCWMIENLRLESTNSDNSTGNLAQGYGASTTYGNFSGLADAESANFSYFTTANSLYYSGTQEGTASIDIGTSNYPGYRMPRYNNVNTSTRASSPTSNGVAMYSYGNYYTWHAAIADLTHNGTNNQSTTNTSLCPTGWHLPQSGDKTRIESNDDNDFWNLTVDALNGGVNPANYSSSTYPYYTGTAEARPVANKLRSFPNNFLYSGIFGTSSAGGRGSSGYYWSSTANSNIGSYFLYLDSPYVYPGTNYDSKYYGRSIRCMVPSNLYAIHFDANTTDIVTGTMPDQSITIGEATALKANAFQRSATSSTAYRFVKWNTRANGTGTDYADGASVTNLAPVGQTITLYAQWEQITPMTVNFNGNGLNYDNSASVNTVSYYNECATKYVSYPSYSHTSNINNDGTQIGTTKYDNNLATKDVITIPGAESLHATITYGTENNWDMLYVFQGEYTGSVTRNMSAGQLATYMGGNNTTTTVELDIPGDTATFAFYSDGSGQYWGYYANVVGYYSTAPASYASTAQVCSRTIVSGEYKTPVIDSLRTFYGWGENQSATTADYTTADAVLNDFPGNNGETKTLYAVWKNNLTINYNANGGSGTTASQTVAAGESITLKSNGFTAPGANKQFRNWNTKADGTGTSYAANSNFTAPANVAYNDSLTLYAIWDDVYYIAFNANGGSGTMTNQTVARDAATAIKTSTFTRSGFIFRGWNTNASGTGTFYGDGQQVTNLTTTGNTITLYAIWVEGALLDQGTTVNQKLKRLAGNSSASYSTQDNTITALVRSNTLPNGFTPATANTISDSTSPYPIYAWYDSTNTTIYYYSEATNIIMNKNSSSFFYEMRALSDLSTISTWNTVKVTTMSQMFYYTGYSATTFTLDLSSWDTSSVTNMASMFFSSGRSATTWSVGDLSSWNTSSVTNMSSMFFGAGHNAASFTLDLSSWDTSSVTNMSSMFSSSGYSATAWSVGDLSSWNTSSVTNMSNMFYQAGYSATTWSVGDLSSWSTSNVKYMNSMFNQAGYSATTFILDLSSWDTSSVTNMASMFSSSGYSATTWSVGNLSSWNTPSVTNMSYMFNQAGYSATTFTLDLSSWDTSSVTNMSSMFYMAGYDATTFTLNLSSWNTSNVTNMSNMLFYAGYNATTWSITIPKTNNGTATGPISNTTSNLYGSTTSVTATPPSGKSFTLAN